MRSTVVTYILPHTNLQRFICGNNVDIVCINNTDERFILSALVLCAYTRLRIKVREYKTVSIYYIVSSITGSLLLVKIYIRVWFTVPMNKLTTYIFDMLVVDCLNYTIIYQGIHNE